MNKIILK